jgi:aspartate racemase
MAAAYIKAMRAVQPEGPYFLAGFCAGGLIAYEIAQQLRAQGQAVDFLALFDPMAGPIRFIRLLGGFIRCIGSLTQLSPGKQLDWFLRLRYVSRVLRHSRDENTEHVDRLIRRWRDEHPKRFSLIPEAEALRQDWMAVFVWAVSSYSPRQYPGKMTYFFARENPDSRKLWWGKVAETENVEIYTIPGTHETCRTEHIHDLAEHLCTYLTKAQATALS